MTTDGWILSSIQGVSVNFTGALHGSSHRETVDLRRRKSS